MGAIYPTGTALHNIGKWPPIMEIRILGADMESELGHAAHTRGILQAM
jgi:hypothetical protein